MLRGRERLGAPAGEEAEHPRAEVARRVDRPGLEVPRAGADGGHQKPDHERAGVGRRRERVVLLGDGEHAQHQKAGEDDLIDEGVRGRDALAGMGEEHPGGAPVAGAA